MRGAVTIVLACALALGVPIAPRAAEPSVSALDFIELEISYTTLLARFYKPIDPGTLVDGARNGVAAELRARGIENATLPLTPSHVDRATGSDLIDGLVFRTLAKYGSRVDGHALVASAVAGELAILRDPYTLVFRPAAFKKFNAFLGNSSFGGIGAIVSLDTTLGRADIERALPDSPAAKAGLARGDAIVAIDGKSVHEISNGPALLAVLRGKIGTRVALDVKKSGGDIVHLTLVREATHDPEVRSERFGDLTYIALSRFGDRAAREVADVVADAKASGQRGIVLDLRGNGGGYGDEAVGVASLFVADGIVFTERQRTGPPIVHRATGKPLWNGPMNVIVDGDTASASEIVAGVIQDAGRGKIFGVKTFGKGLVQSIFDLPDGSAMKVTTARYTTPAGRDIDRIGITPDVLVPLQSGGRVGEPDFDNPLSRALGDLALPLPSP